MAKANQKTNTSNGSAIATALQAAIGANSTDSNPLNILDVFKGLDSEKMIELFKGLDKEQLLTIMEVSNKESHERIERERESFKDFVNKELANMIEKINKKYPINENGEREFYLNISVSFNKPVIAKMVKDEPSNGNPGETVPFKWQNPNNPAQKWTGRGMTPKWISEILEKEGISKEEFQKDTRFLIPKVEESNNQ